MKSLLRNVFCENKDERSLVIHLFINFLIIMTTFYVIKSVRNSLLIQWYGIEILPQIWAGSVAVLVAVVFLYNRMIDSIPLRRITFISAVIFTVLLAAISLTLKTLPASAIALYVWGDVFSLLMVEQFWSHTNSLFSAHKTKKIYGVIASGGIIGGLLGSAFVALFVAKIGSVEMPLVASAFMVGLVFASWSFEQVMKKHQPKRVTKVDEAPVKEYSGNSAWKIISTNHIFVLTLLTLISLQIISTFIDFQFNKVVDMAYPKLDAKSIFFGQFYLGLNLISLLSVLVFVPPVFQALGFLMGLFILPLANLMGFALTFLFDAPVLSVALKLIDNSLTYSVNRTSRELVFSAGNWRNNNKAKMLIDVLGASSSKFVAAIVIIPNTASFSLHSMSLVNMIVLVFTLFLIFLITKRMKETSKG
jgi:ATP:ADP antiporter, AAA family